MSRPIGSLSRSAARRSGALALAVALSVLTACGGGDDTTASDSTSEAATSSASEAPTSDSAAPTSADAAEGETVTVTTIDFDFELSEDTYSAGTYTFEVTNTGAMPHNFAVERDGQRVGGTEVLQPGGTATLEVTLEEGDYFFYCEVGQHRANGMEVPVTVSA